MPAYLLVLGMQVEKVTWEAVEDGLAHAPASSYSSFIKCHWFILGCAPIIGVQLEAGWEGGIKVIPPWLTPYLGNMAFVFCY